MFLIFSVYVISIAKFCVLFMEASWTFCENLAEIKDGLWTVEFCLSISAPRSDLTIRARSWLPVSDIKQLLRGDQKLFPRHKFLEEGKLNYNFKFVESWINVMLCFCLDASFLDGVIIENRFDRTVPFLWKTREQSLRKTNKIPAFS